MAFFELLAGFCAVCSRPWGGRIPPAGATGSCELFDLASAVDVIGCAAEFLPSYVLSVRYGNWV